MGRKSTRMMRLGNLVVVAALASFGARAGLADTINLSTGTAAYTLSNSSYVTVSNPTGTITPSITDASSFMFVDHLWVADDTAETAKWLSPLAHYDGSEADNNPSQFTWTTSFALSSASTTDLSGFISTDNELVKIIVNGIQLAPIAVTSDTNPTAFSIPSIDLTNGSNSIQYIVMNDGPQATGNPTGLNVLLSALDLSSGQPLPLPASASAGLVLMGGFGLIRKRGLFGKVRMSPLSA
jgi:hypothetical protein